MLVLTEESIKEYYEEFKSNNPETTMSYEQFEDSLLQAYKSMVLANRTIKDSTLDDEEELPF